LSEEDKTVFGVTDADFKVIHFQLVSTGISTVLFRGRRPGSNSIELIYKSLKVVLKLRWVVVEPSMNYIEFDNDSPFRNSWLLGGYAGFDFDTYTEYGYSIYKRKRNYINKFR
jgi:hypothetical protein